MWKREAAQSDRAHAAAPETERRAETKACNARAEPPKAIDSESANKTRETDQRLIYEPRAMPKLRGGGESGRWTGQNQLHLLRDVGEATGWRNNNMKYTVIIRYKTEDGKIKRESVPLTTQNERDAEFQRHINQEVAEKRHGAENVISVTLVIKK